MDTFLTILFLVFIFGGLGKLLSATKAAAKAIVATNKGDGSFTENFKDSLDLDQKGMSALEVRGRIDTEAKSDGFTPIDIQVRGLFPVKEATNGMFVISVFDRTDLDEKGSPEWQTVIAEHERFQEKDNFAFQVTCQAGELKPNFGFTKWVNLGAVIPEILQPPHKGIRKLRAYVRLVNADNPPSINGGFNAPETNSLVLWSGSHDFEWNFTSNGYIDERVAKQNAAKVTVKLAVAVAMIDGELSDNKGKLISAWMKRKLSGYSGKTHDRVRDDMNQAFKSAHLDVTTQSSSYSSLTSELVNCGSRVANIECVDLIYAIISADSSVTSEQLSVVKIIGEVLGVDRDEVEKIADRALAGATLKIEENTDLNELLGIEPSWSADEVRRYLRTEFQKWNNRLSTLNEGPERESAQNRLELIARARDNHK